jgi:hypothetical protein
MESSLETTSGYLHPRYAVSLAEFGTPRVLPRSGGWILERSIPGTALRDAMGCYPLFVCRDWSQLGADLAEVADNLVCLWGVTDPFGDYDEAQLRECFRDKVVRFKEHYYIDLERPREDYVGRHHWRYAHKALAQLHVERYEYENAPESLDNWMSLYEHLIQRHGITGIPAFSRTAFAHQFAVPGFVAFRALHQGTVVGMSLSYIQGNVAYGHLIACNALGYELDSSYALYWREIEYFRGCGLKWLNLGAGAGASSKGGDGLTWFKQGWATGTRTAYFCGRIFDHQAYDQIVKAKGLADTEYFPAYRAGEFR